MADDREQFDLNDAERKALGEWGASLRAPAVLRQATLEAARRRGLVGGRMTGGIGNLLGWAAALAIGTVVGFGVGSRQAAAPVTKAPVEATAPGGSAAPAPTTALPNADYKGPKFVLLLFEDAKYQFAPNDQVLAARVQEYVRWSRDIAKDGRWVRGNKLADEGKWCRLEAGHLAVEGPVSDGKRGLLAGYFLIGAKDLDEAIEVARECPHFKYGGTVEVRRLEG